MEHGGLEVLVLVLVQMWWLSVVSTEIRFDLGLILVVAGEGHARGRWGVTVAKGRGPWSRAGGYITMMGQVSSGGGHRRGGVGSRAGCRRGPDDRGRRGGVRGRDRRGGQKEETVVAGPFTNSAQRQASRSFWVANAA